MATHPLAGLNDVINPAFPGGVAKIAGTVAASQQIHLQHCITRLAKRPRLERGHAPGFVHFFGKWVDVDHQSPNGNPSC